MKRYHTTIPHGAHQVEEVVHIEAEPSPADGTFGFACLVSLMRMLVDQPALLRHSTDCPQKVAFMHNGTAWMVEARSLTTVSDDSSSAGPTSPA